MTEHENPEHEKIVIPAREVVSAAYGEILWHNKEHTGFGTLFGKVIKTALKNEGVAVQVSDDIVLEGDMNAALQDIFHNETFTRIGVKMGQFGNSFTDIDGVAATSKKIVPVIENQSLYGEFLGALEPVDIQDKQLGKLLGDVVDSLGKVVDFAFTDESIAAMPQDERVRVAEVGEDALRTFVAIDDQYVRLGIDSSGLTERIEDLSPSEQYEKQKQIKAYDSLSRKVEYWGRNILTEGIIADEKEYLTPPLEQGFGPANWHKDGGQRYWAAALGFLNQMQQSERTQEFGVEVKEGLLASVDAAIEEINNAKEELYYSGQKDDLVNLRAALNGEEYDIKKFLLYTKPLEYLR